MREDSQWGAHNSVNTKERKTFPTHKPAKECCLEDVWCVDTEDSDCYLNIDSRALTDAPDI